MNWKAIVGIIIAILLFVILPIVLFVVFYKKSTKDLTPQEKQQNNIDFIKKQASIVVVGNSNAAEKIYANNVINNFSANPIVIDPTVLSTSNTLQFTGSSPNVQLLAVNVVQYNAKYS